MTLFLRLLSVFVGVGELGLFYLQMKHPSWYPWPLAIAVLAFPVAAFAIAWRRVSLLDAAQKIAPSFFLLGSLAFSVLLAEGTLAIATIILLASLTSFVSLELLFLLAYTPHRYPVNGLSHVNVAFVPIAVWYFASTSSGLIVFLHTARGWHAVLLAIVGALLFRTTGHAAATAEQHRLWTVVGALVGLHVGLLGMMLPVSMPMQGAIASLFLAAVLRTRRYIYEPRPSERQAWIEAGSVLVGLFAVLITAKWI